MSTGTSLATAVSYIAVLFFIYFGITKISDFKKQPAEKQLAGKKRLKTAMFIGAAAGLFKIFAGLTNA